MIPIDEFNRFTIAADANKFLVPTYPKRNSDESEVDYQNRLQKEYYDVSSISGIFKSFSDAPGGAKRRTSGSKTGVFGAEYVYNEQVLIACWLPQRKRK